MFDGETPLIAVNRPLKRLSIEKEFSSLDTSPFFFLQEFCSGTKALFYL